MGRVNEKDALAVSAAKLRDMCYNGAKIQTKQMDIYDLMIEGAPVQTAEIIARYREKFGANKEQTRGLVNTSLRALRKKGKVKSLGNGLWVRL